MIVRVLIALALLGGGIEAQLSPEGAEVDTLVFADVPVAVVAEQLGDSLFAPPARRARIFRDHYGAPHIYGQTDRDVAFGFGFAQAESHLMPMLLNFRQARGQRAEISGSAYLEADYKALLWRIHSLSGERYGDIPKPARDYIEAFVAGINHYIAINRRVLPSWVQDVSAVDVVALSRWILFLYAEQSGLPELRQKDLVATAPPLPGSNQWAVSGQRTTTGAPMFAMDVQMPYAGPFQMCEARLVSQEGLRVYGATFFGWPAIFAGHNDHLTWSMTLNDIDVFDLFEERLDPANPRRYFYQDERLRISSRRVEIRVRGEPGQGVYEVERELLYTGRGPVYKMMDNWAYSARTSMESQVGVLSQLLAMNKAAGLDDFRVAMARLELPVFNVMYADVEGHLFYVFNGRSPVRSDAYDWRTAVPGWTPETEWRGIHTLSQLPQVLNPPSGFLQNNNVAPDLVTVESGISPGAFPPYLGWGSFNHRGQRALNWLLVHRNISAEDMQRLLRDDYLIDAEELKGLILRAYNRAWAEIYDPEGQVGKAIHLLRAWDNRASVSSLGTALFLTWKARFDPMLAQLPEASRRDVLALEKIALVALRQAVEAMLATHGRLDVPWGEIHVLTRGDATFPMSGSTQGAAALRQTWVASGDQGAMAITGGSAFAMVVSLEQPVRAWSALAFGNSEDPASPHFADQAALQSRNAFKRVALDEADLRRDMTSVATVPFEGAELERQILKAHWRNRLLPVEGDR